MFCPIVVGLSIGGALSVNWSPVDNCGQESAIILEQSESL